MVYGTVQCSGSLGRCCDGSGMSVGLRIALLLLGCSLVGVFQCGLSLVLLAMLVYFVRCPSLVVVGFRQVSRPANLCLLHPGTVKQGLCSHWIFQKTVCNTSRPLCSWCSWIGSPSLISGSKSGASICITSPVFMCWVE